MSPLEQQDLEPPVGTARNGLRLLFGRDLAYVALWATPLGFATLLTPIITRLLGPSGYGLAAVSVAIMQLLVAVAGSGLNVAIQRTYAGAGDRAARKLITVSLVIAALAFLVLTISGPLWAGSLRLGPYRGAVAYAVAWAMLSAVSQTVLALLRSRDRLDQFALVTLLQTSLAEALSLGLVLFVRRTADEYILGELIGQAATLVVALALARPEPLRRVDHHLMRVTLGFALPLIPVTIANFIMSTSSRLVLNADSGRVAAARFTVASNVGSIASLLVYALFEAWMPRVFALTDEAAVPRVLAHSRDALYALLIPTTIGLSATSPLLLRLWAPGSFRPDTLQLDVVIFIVATFPYAGATTSSRGLIRDGRTGAIARIALCAAGFNLLLSLLLVPELGLFGAALATLAALTFVYVMTDRLSQGLHPAPAPPRSLSRAIAVTTMVCFATVLIPTNLPFLLLRGLLGVLCAAAVAFGLRWLRANPDLDRLPLAPRRPRPRGLKG